MSLEKTMDELERHIDYAASYFADVKLEFENLEGEYIDEIAELKDEVEKLEEQNYLLEEQVDDLSKKLAIFELENMELRLRIEVYNLVKHA
jgi:predicted  nucleic acid-binding Zn-ribbon protein